jgi:hypothetical protein
VVHVRGEAQTVEDKSSLTERLLGIKPESAPEEDQVLICSEQIEQTGLLGAVADSTADNDVAFIVAVDSCGYPHKRGFAGSVFPNECERLTAVQVEVNSAK